MIASVTPARAVGTVTTRSTDSWLVYGSVGDSIRGAWLVPTMHVTDLFEPVDKKYKVYTKKAATTPAATSGTW